MMLTKFKITWPSGAAEEDLSSDSHTADAYAMQRWGIESAARLTEQFNTAVEVVDPVPATDPVPVGEVVDPVPATDPVPVGEVVEAPPPEDEQNPESL